MDTPPPLQLPALLEANDKYERDAFHKTPRTPRPRRQLVILACMDARLDLFRALGLDVGDSHVLRNAGGRASEDAIRSLIVSTHLLGTREIGVIHHTNCGLEGMTDEAVAAAIGMSEPPIPFLAFDSVEESVAEDVEAIRRCGYLPDGVIVWGAVYNVDDGHVRMVVEPSSPDPT